MSGEKQVSDNTKLYEEKRNRVLTAVSGGQPDRVPNAVRVGSYAYRKTDITMAETMVDHERACKINFEFFEKHPTFDTATIANAIPSAKVMEYLGVKTARWPGDAKGLDVNNSYQFLEFPTLLEDEYDEMFDDAAGFLFRKYLPRTMELFEPFEDINFMSMIGSGARLYFTDPKRIPAYKKLIAACEETEYMQRTQRTYEQKLRDLGFYTINGKGSAMAFDMLADGLRGTFGMMPDLILQRDNVKRALDKFVHFHIQNSLTAKKPSGEESYAWVMLHKGFDNFISEQDYAELYWPYLQQWILALIDNGITPVVYTEGSYNTRLKFLKDVPKGKVIYHFEEVDIKLAKKEIGDVACIMGGFPNYTVSYGTPKEIDEKVKETIDILAPGGGYIFATGYSIEDCPEENMEALLSAIEKYGKY